MRITRRLLALVVLGLLLAALTSSPAVGTLPGSNGLIAFVRVGNIYTFDPATGVTTQLTTRSGFSTPQWSPNGEQLAYKNRVGAIFVRKMSTGKTVRVATGAGDGPGWSSGPIWSPHGHRIGFLSTLTASDEIPCGVVGLYTVSASGAAKSLLWSSYSEGFDYCAYGPDLRLGTWSPDGRSILLTGCGSSEGADWCWLGALQVAQAEARRPSIEQTFLMYCYPDEQCTWPRVSAGDYGPGGQRILFSARGGYATGQPEQAVLPYWDTPSRIYVVDTAGAPLHQVSCHPRGHSATWAPDGSKVLFVKTSKSTSRIVETSSVSANATTTTLIKNASQPDWQPVP